NGGLTINDIKFKQMDERPFYRRPWFYIAGWLAFLLLMYGAQIYRMGGWRANLTDLLFDLLCVFPLFFFLWMAFFAQFVLPVKTFRDRQKIFDRLRSHFSGGHGPALFIENGVIKEHSGERLKKGPGVVWLDSASAAVTRTAVAIKQTLGPGVHFIERGEYIAGTLDLHTQVQALGPRDNDRPFGEKKEGQPDEEWRQIQDRRKMVSALTRDGIEVIPNISVIFRVDTGFPIDNEPGSRFGYRTGITKRARENEKKDQDAIRKAILGQGINPNVEPDSVSHRIAWNELPASLAVDVWREYAAKFTLDELFAAGQDVPPPPPPLTQPAEEDIDPLSRPIAIDPNRRTMQSGLASMLREINKLMDRAIKYLENDTSQPVTPPAPGPVTSPGNGSEEPVKKTALQVINEMVTARLTQPQVDVLGDAGQRGEGKVDSEEFKLLEERGLKVSAVSISNIRMDPSLEDQLIKQFSTSWLKTARAESDQLDRKRNVIEISAQERAHINYATLLSREINEQARKGKPEVKGILKTLLLRSRAMIRSGEHSDQLRRRMITELQEIEELIRWVEENGK
ncbi:MAG TPA: hypothetical protein VHO49_13810, partial [Anaerolineales bacterium]|nr:hypothetical protein [Anaerolineales bacterium]